jgi:hypothetical protein
MQKHRSALVLAALLAAACGTRHPATREELARSVERALSSEQPCIADKHWVLPAKVATNDLFAAELIRGFDALAKAGLVQRAEAVDTVDHFTLGPDGGSRPAVVPAKQYTLTDAGRPFYRTYESPGYGKVGAFCFGHWKAEVASFSDPAESSNGNLTTVVYTRRLVDVPAWAEDSVLATSRTDRAHGVGTGAQERMSLVQTDTGWVLAGF